MIDAIASKIGNASEWHGEHVENDFECGVQARHSVTDAAKPSRSPAPVRIRTASPTEAAAQLRDAFRLSELERRMQTLAAKEAELSARVSRLESSGIPLGQNQRAFPVSPLNDVVEITSQLFPGKVCVEQLYDPSEPSLEFVVFSVIGAGDLDDLFEKELEWGRRVSSARPQDCEQFRLNVVPVG